MSAFARLHVGYVHERRTDVLSRHLAELLPHGASVLDVGAGDGLIAKKLLARRPDLELQATEVLVRPETHVPVTPFDGTNLPFEEGSVDAVVLVDVLHHAADPHELLRQSRRVARDAVVIKDVTTRGIGASATLHLMERLANAKYGIAMPERFWSPSEWESAFRDAALEVVAWRPKLGLYPFPASLAFERSFHFLASLRPR